MGDTSTSRVMRRARACLRWHRPLLETFEQRLPPGDTLLGFFSTMAFLDPALSDAFAQVPAFDLETQRWVTGAESAAADEAPDELATARRINRDIEDSTPATLASEYVATWSGFTATWPGTSAIAMPDRPRGSVASNESLATRPHDHGVMPGRAISPFKPVSATIGARLDVMPTRPTPAMAQTAESVGRVSMPSAASGNYGSQPFYFEQNVGQADEAFDFVARGAGYSLGLSATEAIMQLQSPSDGNRAANLQQAIMTGDSAGLLPDGRRIGADHSEPAAGPVVRMQVAGGNSNAQATTQDQLVTKINYFIGNDPARWHTNVPTFGKVQYDNVYPGIDLVYYSNQGQLEYDFIVSPGVDPNLIQLNFAGADSVAINAAGDLIVQAADIEARQPRPYIYQEVNGTRQQVDGNFILSAATDNGVWTTDGVAFDVSDYDTSVPLVIDPIWLTYSTYLGGPGYDYGYDVAVDKFGSAYVTGEAGPGFPLVNPALPYGGGKDAFVSKFSPDGQTLFYSTFIGGQYEDSADSIAVDGKGGAYITGYTLSLDFPSTPGAFQPANGDEICYGTVSCADAFITKLGPDGASLVYSTYLGTIWPESGDGIAVDADGSAYVMGQTNSADFPILNAAQPTYGGGGCNEGIIFYPCYDVFVTKLNPSGSALVYSTYLGGNLDEAYTFHATGDIAIDPAGHAYLTGYTESWNFPTHNPLQPTKLPGLSSYITKLSSDGSTFVYSTYLGGSVASDLGRGIAADPAGNAYVTGVTWAPDFPTTSGAFQSVTPGVGDVFVSKVKPDGSAFVYSTFLGGSNYEYGYAIVADQWGNAYVTGSTYSTNFPIKMGFQPTFGGGQQDAFVTKFKPTGEALAYSSYLGGDGSSTNGDDGALGIALDNWGNAYIAGTTRSTTFPTVKPFQVQNAGNIEAFLTKVGRVSREAIVVVAP